jgi:hypothetical protein
MSRDEQRRRVPTSDELERQGALMPAADPAAQLRRGLMRFFRAGRFRVSDDVAARKHVGVASPRLPTTAPEGDATQEPVAASAPPTGTLASAPTPHRPADPIVPRKIRIDPSVKDRRGLGQPGNKRGQR